MTKYPYIRKFLKQYVPSKKKKYLVGIMVLLITIILTVIIPLFIKDAVDLLNKDCKITTKDNQQILGSLSFQGENIIIKEETNNIEHIFHKDDITIDYYLSQESKDKLRNYSLLILVFGILLCISRALSRILIFLPGREIESQVREDFFQSVLTLPQYKLQQYTSGDLISRGTSDITSIRVMISMGVLHSINSAFLIILCLYFMMQISLSMTLYCFIPLPLIIIGTRLISRTMMKYNKKSQKSLGILSESIREQFKAHSLFKIFPVFDRINKRFIHNNNNYFDNTIKLMKSRVYMTVIIGSTASFALFILLRYGGALALENKFALGDFMAFILYLGMLGGPLTAVGWLLSIMQRGEACLSRIYEVYDQSQESLKEQENLKINTEDKLYAKLSSPLIQLSKVKFSYDNSSFELDIPNMIIHEGKTYGIFGKTGCGKSTLINLLSNNLNISSGEISFGNISYKEIVQDVLLKQFSIVSQDNRHFAGSIIDNIENINQEVTHNKKNLSFEDAYNFSQLKNDVETFPNKLNTILGEHGLNLSGGQKQRLAILRALIKPHKILILDDFTSALDQQTEMKVISSLQEFLNNNTAILISHKISSLINCDHIFIMEDGKIIEEGSHQELLKKNALYLSTYNYQQQVNKS